VTGSPRFAKLVRAGQYAEALQVARQQVEGGAQILDVNMDEGLLDSALAMRTFLNLLAAEPDIARVPIMVDSSDWQVLETGLKCLRARGSSTRSRSRKARRRSATGPGWSGATARGLVMAFDRRVKRPPSIDGSRSSPGLPDPDRRRGVSGEDVIFDPNVLTVGTGIESTRTTRSASSRLPAGEGGLPPREGQRGISNVSFSFRGNNPVREAMHAASSTTRFRPASTWAS